MEAYSETSSYVMSRYFCKKCQNACVVRRSKNSENLGRKFYACDCVDGNFFRTWCDEVQAVQQLGTCENGMEDIKRIVKAGIEDIRKDVKAGVEDIKKIVKVGFIIMFILNIILYLHNYY
jgi:GRF zinc finger